MKKLLLSLAFLTATTYPNVLLEKPRILSPAEIEERATNWQTGFTWRFGIGCNVMLTYDQAQAGFLVQLLGVPIRSYNFPYIAAIKEIMKPKGKNPEYYFRKPLKIEKPSPASLTHDELCEFLKDKTFTFYTGAGISASGNVATMHDLMQSLKLNDGIPNFIKAALFYPQAITSAFDDFCVSAIKGAPTPAHNALHALTQHKNIGILTENVDLLQQRTGSEPLFMHSDTVFDVTPQELQEVNVLICVGLSHDDCGFIAHYKAHNPHGILIAIDRGMPNYLSENDYIVQEDLQMVLPHMAHYFCESPA